jgi:hypothetical protein
VAAAAAAAPAAAAVAAASAATAAKPPRPKLPSADGLFLGHAASRAYISHVTAESTPQVCGARPQDSSEAAAQASRASRAASAAAFLGGEEEGVSRGVVDGRAFCCCPRSASPTAAAAAAAAAVGSVIGLSRFPSRERRWRRAVGLAAEREREKRKEAIEGAPGRTTVLIV